MKQFRLTRSFSTLVLAVAIALVLVPVAYAGGAVSHHYAPPPLDAGSALPNPDYATGGGNTLQGLKADGLRLQALADMFTQMPTVQGLRADGLRLEALADTYRRLENRPAASFYTPQALKAQGLRLQAMAHAYGEGSERNGSSNSAGASGFDWSAAVVGAASMLAFALVGVALLLGVRRMHRPKLAV